MNGVIGVDSTENEGTTFWITIPFKVISERETINPIADDICFYQNSEELNALTHQQYSNLGQKVTNAK